MSTISDVQVNIDNLLADLGELPHKLWVLSSAEERKFVCYYFKNYDPCSAYGFVCFTQKEAAEKYLNSFLCNSKSFLEVYPDPKAEFAPLEKEFEKLRQRAKLTKETNCVIILDDMTKPIVHFVK